jgi:hypothetical protein
LLSDHDEQVGVAYETRDPGTDKVHFAKRIAYLIDPEGTIRKAYEVGDFHADTARFDRDASTHTVTVARKGKTKVTTFQVAKDAQDLTTAFMWLSKQPLEVAHHYEIPVASGSHQFTLVADVLGRERVEAPAGTFETVKVKVRTELDGKFSTKRDSTLWLSDDGRHVLVRGYGTAVVYSFPGFEPVASVGLPRQKQGEGVSIGPSGRIRLSSEGRNSPVLQVELPRRVMAALAGEHLSGTFTPTPHAEPRPAPDRPGPTGERGRGALVVAVGAGAAGILLLLVLLLPRRTGRRP